MKINSRLAILVISLLLLPFTILEANSKPKNVIMIVGDGMSPAYTSAYRYYMDDPATTKVENTVFDQLLVGMASTYSAGTRTEHKNKSYVTDSAAAATALSTGVKTYNGAVALDVNQQPLQTIMEYAKSREMITGLVVSSQINHATPASYVAHNVYRYNYNAIADSFFDNRVNGKFVADLMFGGGQKYFIRQDRNIANEFEKAGYQYFNQFAKLASFDRLPALGIFASKGLGFAIDSPEKYRLRSMVKKALALMENSDNGYFLLIEGSLIDWCGHDNDISCAMNEVDDLAKTVEFVKNYIDGRNDTLMVMTADHGTGGLSIGADDLYLWQPTKVAKIKKSVNYVAKKLLLDQNVNTLWQQYVGIDINPQQLAQLTKVQQQSLSTIKASQLLGPAKRKKKISSAKSNLEQTLAAIIAKNTVTGWTSGNHTGGDVQVFAYGYNKQLFNGYQDNTDIAKKLFKLIKN
jgi:alkaline phosphatase